MRWDRRSSGGVLLLAWLLCANAAKPTQLPFGEARRVVQAALAATKREEKNKLGIQTTMKRLTEYMDRLHAETAAHASRYDTGSGIKKEAQRDYAKRHKKARKLWKQMMQQIAAKRYAQASDSAWERSQILKFPRGVRDLIDKAIRQSVMLSKGRERAKKADAKVKKTSTKKSSTKKAKPDARDAEIARHRVDAKISHLNKHTMSCPDRKKNRQVLPPGSVITLKRDRDNKYCHVGTNLVAQCSHVQGQGPSPTMNEFAVLGAGDCSIALCAGGTDSLCSEAKIPEDVKMHVTEQSPGKIIFKQKNGRYCTIENRKEVGAILVCNQKHMADAEVFRYKCIRGVCHTKHSQSMHINEGESAELGEDPSYYESLGPPYDDERLVVLSDLLIGEQSPASFIDARKKPSDYGSGRHASTVATDGTPPFFGPSSS